MKKVFPEILKNSQENTFARGSFFQEHLWTTASDWLVEMVSFLFEFCDKDVFIEKDGFKLIFYLLNLFFRIDQNGIEIVQ